MFILSGTIHDPSQTRGKKLVWEAGSRLERGRESILPAAIRTQVSLLRQQRILAARLGRRLSLSLSLSLSVFTVLACVLHSCT